MLGIGNYMELDDLLLNDLNNLLSNDKSRLDAITSLFSCTINADLVNQISQALLNRI